MKFDCLNITTGVIKKNELYKVETYPLSKFESILFYIYGEAIGDHFQSGNHLQSNLWIISGPEIICGPGSLAGL